MAYLTPIDGKLVGISTFTKSFRSLRLSLPEKRRKWFLWY